MSPQLPLFGDADTIDPADVPAEIRRLGTELPQRVRLGTSSWSFPGWTGLVFAARSGRPAGEQALARHGLSAYAAHPLLRTVSLDRTFYAPLTRDEFATYATQVPESFRFVVKAPAAFTDPVIRNPGSGAASGDNPSFLDASAAAAVFVEPAIAGLGTRCGPLVFQFPPLGRRQLADVPRITARIAAFMAALRYRVAADLTLAVEIRDPELASPAFAAGLGDASATPCLAAHARMPPVADQAAAFGLDHDDCPLPLVARWNLHAGHGYEQAKQAYFPFDRLVEEDVPTRRSLARLAARTAAGGREVFITINNKAEGSAPLSVVKLAAAITEISAGHEA
ncbi:MAG: DUF72 domain-containing protein [Planctomycetota bacterium]|nr:DUF72 domain-containing protein [Planctomycetota bacterium]